MMMGFKRAVCVALLSSAAAIAAAPATPATPPSATKVEQAIAAHDYRGAMVALNTLIAERLPVSDKRGPDIVLDRLFAQVLSLTGTPASSIALLKRLTTDSALSGADRVHYQFLLAVAYDEAGQFADAERLYGSIRDDRSALPDDRLSATLGSARLHMMANPGEAIASLQAVQAPLAKAWEVDLLLGRAEALAGRDDAAAAATQRAWAAAPMAGAEQGAPARVASDMLVAAGRAGNRERLLSLLAVDRLNRGPSSGQEALGSNVPLCGVSGIRPDDSVVVEFLRQAPPGRPRFSLVWASRPEIAAPFMLAVAQNPGFQVTDGQAAAVVLKCRTAPSADYQVRADFDSQVLSWSTSRGAYPLTDTSDNADPASLASLLAERERRYGPKSAMLLPVLMLVLTPTIQNGSDNQEARTRAAALAHRIIDIVSSNGGPADIILLLTLQATALDVAAQTKSVAAAQAEFQSLMTQASRNPDVSLDMLHLMVSGATGYSQTPTVLRAQLLEQAIAVLRARTTLADPRVSSLALRLVGVRREQGDDAAVVALTKEYGFAPDLCSVANPAVRFTSSNITPDDYPTDMVQTLQPGRTILEFSIGATGAATHPRILVADPPYAFDAVALEKSSTIVYEPAKTSGVARTCRAQVQPIRWQLPY